MENVETRPSSTKPQTQNALERIARQNIQSIRLPKSTGKTPGQVENQNHRGPNNPYDGRNQKRERPKKDRTPPQNGNMGKRTTNTQARKNPKEPMHTPGVHRNPPEPLVERNNPEQKTTEERDNKDTKKLPRRFPTGVETQERRGINTGTTEKRRGNE